VKDRIEDSVKVYLRDWDSGGIINRRRQVGKEPMMR